MYIHIYNSSFVESLNTEAHFYSNSLSTRLKIASKELCWKQCFFLLNEILCQTQASKYRCARLQMNKINKILLFFKNIILPMDIYLLYLNSRCFNPRQLINIGPVLALLPNIVPYVGVLTSQILLFTGPFIGYIFHKVIFMCLCIFPDTYLQLISCKVLLIFTFAIDTYLNYTLCHFHLLDHIIENNICSMLSSTKIFFIIYMGFYYQIKLYHLPSNRLC